MKVKNDGVEPFLKWAGGKRRLIDQIFPALPPLRSDSTYREPFLGSGALFFGLGHSKAVLSDLNSNLIETYAALRDCSDLVISSLRGLDPSKETYYRVRNSRPRTPHTRAAKFIYLNKTCFNGLYRVNLHDEFNVPFGAHGPNVVVRDHKQLTAASEALRGTELLSSDFETALSDAVVGDLVFLDPPYTTAHSQNGFIEYNARVFSWEDQRRLASVARSLAKNNVSVAITNAAHPSITRLYPRSVFERTTLSRWNTMAADSKKRFKGTEVLFVSR